MDMNARNSIRRQILGCSGALSQDQHSYWNSREPGLTREHCFICGTETGRAGKSEDSIYDEDDAGPYCEDCYRSGGEA
jgi:hypothetical protein